VTNMLVTYSPPSEQGMLRAHATHIIFRYDTLEAAQASVRDEDLKEAVEWAWYRIHEKV